MGDGLTEAALFREFYAGFTCGALFIVAVVMLIRFLDDVIDDVIPDPVPPSPSHENKRETNE